MNERDRERRPERSGEPARQPKRPVSEDRARRVGGAAINSRNPDTPQKIGSKAIRGK